MKRLAAFAVNAGGIVTTLTGEQLSVGRGTMSCLPGTTGPPTTRRPGQRVDRATLRRVTVTLAPAADREVRQRVVPRRFCRVQFLVVVGVDAAQHDADVGGRDPVLQHRTDVELARRRSTLERDEGDPGAPGPWSVGRDSVGAERFLFVGSTGDAALRSVVYFATLRRVIVERSPRASVVGTLVDRHRVRRSWTELQADVCHLRPVTRTPISSVLVINYHHIATPVLYVSRNSLPQTVISDLTVTTGTFKNRLKSALYGRAFLQ